VSALLSLRFDSGAVRVAFLTLSLLWVLQTSDVHVVQHACDIDTYWGNVCVDDAALPRAVTERGILETWDVQSAEEIPVAPILLNTQVSM